jgi:hypothetical protein
MYGGKRENFYNENSSIKIFPEGKGKCMKKIKNQQGYVTFMMLILSVLFITGCGGGGSDEAALFYAQANQTIPETPVTEETPVIPSIPVVVPGAVCTEAGPSVISSNPSNNDEGVSRGKVITVTFSEPMDPTTIEVTDAANPESLVFTLRDNNGASARGTVAMSMSNKVATFTPVEALNADSWYTAIITTYAKSAGGTSLGCSYRWQFKTGTATAAGQAPVFLGTASTYAVFASAASITLAVDSLVNGNVGLNPNGACNNCVVGTTVKNGVIENGTPAAIQAQADFNAAYAEASIRATGACSLSSPSNISAAQADCNGFTPGPTYRPGLYRTADPIGFTGTITLDAQGDSSAVFIFQTDSAMTTATESVVVLTGGAKANNVYWISYAASTLGVSSTFKGTIIANSAAITVMKGVSPTPLTDVEGRLFAGAAITVDEFATVTVPLP